MMLTKEEIAALMPVIDAGIKAAGVQIFQNNGGVLIQSVLAKIQQMVDDAEKDIGAQTGAKAAPSANT